MYLWMPMAIWSVVRMVGTSIDWCARIRYEQARTAAVIAILQSVPGGATVQDRRDGTILWIEIPAKQDHHPSWGNMAEMPKRRAC
jgi:DNA-binding transcriptional MocR family regulator